MSLKLDIYFLCMYCVGIGEMQLATFDETPPEMQLTSTVDKTPYKMQLTATED